MLHSIWRNGIPLTPKIASQVILTKFGLNMCSSTTPLHECRMMKICALHLVLKDHDLFGQNLTAFEVFHFQYEF